MIFVIIIIIIITVINIITIMVVITLSSIISLSSSSSLQYQDHQHLLARRFASRRFAVRFAKPSWKLALLFVVIVVVVIIMNMMMDMMMRSMMMMMMMNLDSEPLFGRIVVASECLRGTDFPCILNIC